MRADRGRFHFTGRIDAHENEALVFTRDFRESVPRDHQ